MFSDPPPPKEGELALVIALRPPMAVEGDCAGELGSWELKMGGGWVYRCFRGCMWTVGP